MSRGSEVLFWVLKIPARYIYKDGLLCDKDDLKDELPCYVPLCESPDALADQRYCLETSRRGGEKGGPVELRQHILQLLKAGGDENFFGYYDHFDNADKWVPEAAGNSMAPGGNLSLFFGTGPCTFICRRNRNSEDTLNVPTRELSLYNTKQDKTLPISIRAFDRSQSAAKIVLKKYECAPPDAILLCKVTAILYPPDYWPAAELGVMSNACQALQNAVKLAAAKSQVVFKVVDAAGSRPFIRDKAIYFLDTQQREIKSLDRKGANDGHEMGGNYLAAFNASDEYFIFYGYDAYRDKKPETIEELSKNLTMPVVHQVGVDTSWLKVMHIDEIVSFSGDGVALVASLDLALQIMDLQRPPYAEVIDAILNDLAEWLRHHRFKVHRVPVYFIPTDINYTSLVLLLPPETPSTACISKRQRFCRRKRLWKSVYAN